MPSALVQRFRNDIAPRLLARFSNDGVQAIANVYLPGAGPLDPPSSSPTATPFNCSVRGVSSSILTADPNLVASDLQAICAAIDFQPIVGGQIEINGSVRAVVRFDAIPAAGDPAAYLFFLR